MKCLAEGRDPRTTPASELAQGKPVTVDADADQDEVLRLMEEHRDRLPTDVVAHLGAQLPSLVRGVFYEGWNPHPTPAKFERQEYLDRFSHEASLPTEDAEDIVRAVTRAVFLHIPPEQLEHVFDTLPHDLRSLVTPAA